jgi:hypothetical protein
VLDALEVREILVEVWARVSFPAFILNAETQTHNKAPSCLVS